MEEYLTLQEVAEKLKVHVITIKRLVWGKKIPCIVVGRLYRFRQEDIDEFIKRQTTKVD